jgi:glycosyltransferase involved in cell wall biosynthesis
LKIGVLRVDVRKALDAGIGTYIRQVVPKVIRRMDGLQVEFLIQRGESPQQELFEGGEARLIEIDAAPLSLREQVGLRRAPNSGRLLWAPSISHGLFSNQHLFVTIHDMAQVYGGRSVATRAVSVIAAVYFHSLLRSARGIACVSRFTLDQVKRFLGRDPAVPFGVTPLGVSPAWRHVAGGPVADPPYFLFIGSIRPHKNLATLLRAFSQVIDEIPHHLVLVGNPSGMDREVREALTSGKLAEAGRVRIAGTIPHDDLVELTSGATALVFPSLYEGFGLPPLEAMAAGCPVIASNVTSIPEVCGDAALYFDPYSPEQLANRLRELATLDSMHRHIIVEAGLRQSQAFTWDRCADLTAGLLRECIAQLNGNED